MKTNKLSFTTRYVLLFGILLIVTNLILGVVILNQSKYAMTSLINKNMLDIVNSAAKSIDGDMLGALTEEDVGGENFKHIADQLTVFMDSVDIEFIYAVKQTGPDTFVFTVDPDPVDPGEFGEEVLVTDALREAGTGVASVDSAPAADRWGNFYSAYSPVFDSRGNIAGIIGIDFNAEWFQQQIDKYSFSIAVIAALSVAIGILVVYYITYNVRKKMNDLNTNLVKLSENVDMLMGEMAEYAGFENNIEHKVEVEEGDELELLSKKIANMQEDMNVYLNYMHAQAYTDSLTGVGNSTAYHDKIAQLNEEIRNKTADFTVVVFDVNSLKELNDNFGHECGDDYIKATAKAISEIFGAANTYRIGGDEFAIIHDNRSEDKLDDLLKEVSNNIKKFNRSEKEYDADLYISYGNSSYDKEKDESYRQVFARADQNMYEYKKKYYQTIGDRRARNSCTEV
ncbi:MAG: diguanylate cyclase [Erysipelotrichaceae bacterium]|nr:diguanylate cyclase [Erysipelotrichaceae bacterium]